MVFIAEDEKACGPHLFLLHASVRKNRDGKYIAMVSFGGIPRFLKSYTKRYVAIQACREELKRFVDEEI